MIMQIVMIPAVSYVLGTNVSVPSAAVLVGLTGHEAWSSSSTVPVLPQAASCGRWYRATDPSLILCR